MMYSSHRFLSILLLPLTLLLHMPAEAYIGPGAGLSLMGSLLSTLGVVFIVVLSILFWPLRYAWNRLRRHMAERNSHRRAPAGSAAQSSSNEENSERAAR